MLKQEILLASWKVTWTGKTAQMSLNCGKDICDLVCVFFCLTIFFVVIFLHVLA